MQTQNTKTKIERAMKKAQKRCAYVFFLLFKLMTRYSSVRRVPALGYIGLVVVFAVMIVQPFIPINTNAATGINETLNFHGRLRDAGGGVVADGYYHMRFKIYQGGDGNLGGGDETQQWTESYSGASTSARVRVENGYFNVALGSNTAFGTSVDWNDDTLWLSMEVGGSTSSANWDGEMDPFKRLTAVPYAFNSDLLDGLDSTQLARTDQNETFDNNVTIQGTAIFGTSSTLGQLQMHDGTGQTGTLQTATLAQNTVFTLPDPGQASATICLTTGNCTGSSGGSAPHDAQYLTLALDGDLSNERVLNAGTNISFTDGGANGNLTVATVNNPTFSTSVTTPLLTTSSGDITINPSGNTIVQGSTSDNSAAALNVQDSTSGSLLFVRNDGHVGIGTVNPNKGLTLGETLSFAMQMAEPTNVSTSVSNSGGSLGTGTYYYTVTALDSTGETIESIEASCEIVILSGNDTCTVSWDSVFGADNYRVYKGTSSGGQNEYFTTSNTSYVDDGTAGTAGAPPTTNTAHINLLNGNGDSFLNGGNFGIGTASPNEKLTIDGVFSLEEQSSSPGASSGYGKLYVKDDNKIYYQDDSGTEFDLTATGDTQLTETEVEAYVFDTDNTAGATQITANANGIDMLTLQRNTDSSPTGNFITLENAAASTLFNIDITGTVTNGVWEGTAIADTYIANDLTISSAGSVDGAALQTGTVTNAKLANSSVNYGGVSVSLGGSDLTPAFDLTDATSLPINSGTTGTLNVSRGGTGATSLTDGGILLGSGTGAVTATSVLTNGQLLIGDGTGDPTIGTLTGGTGITVTNGAGTISIANDLGTDIDSSEIVDGTIGEIDLNVSNAETSGFVLSSDGAGGFTWVQDQDSDTTYSAGNDLDLSGTTFNIQSQLDFVSTINRSSGNLTLQTGTGDILIDAGGNLGINNSSPSTDLHLGTEDSGAQKTLRIAGGGTGVTEGGEIQISLAADYDGTFDYFAIDAFEDDLRVFNNGSTRFTVQGNTGNVGIGDTSPASLLTVGAGDAFQVNSSGAIAAATGITSSGGITFSGLTNCETLATDGSGVISCDPDDGTTYSAGNDLDLSGTTFNIESQLDFVSTITRASSNLTLQTTTSGNILLSPAGNVGIGDSTPASLFTVGSGDAFQVNSSGAIAAATGITSSGTITFSGLDCSANANGGALTANASGVISCSDDDGGSGAAAGGSDGQIQYNSGGNFGGASAFYYDDTTDFLGIATSNPQYGLHQFGGGQRLEHVPTPQNVSATADGLGGGSSYTYYVVAEDRNGNYTLAGSDSMTDGYAATSGLSTHTITWDASTGAVTYHVLKNGTSGSVKIGQTTSTSFTDSGQSTSSFTTPSRNETADSIIDGHLAVGTTTTANAALTVQNPNTDQAIVVREQDNGNDAVRIEATNTSGNIEILSGGSVGITLSGSGSGTFSGSLNIQGGSVNAGTSTQAGSITIFDGSSHTGTFSTTSLSSNRTYTLPNLSGTVCLLNQSCAPDSGSANYINNTAAVQSANFFVQSSASSSPAGRLQAHASQSGAVLLVEDSSGGDVLFVSESQFSFTPEANSLFSFNFENSSGTSLLYGDATNGQVFVGEPGTSDDFNVAGNSTFTGNLTLQGGTATFGTSTQAGSLVVNDGSSNTGTISTAALGSNRTYSLPNESGTFCLQNSSNCGFATGSGQAFLQDGNSFGTTATLGTNDTQSLVFETNGSEAMRILSNGNVGIGETNPSSKFAVSGGASLFTNTSTSEVVAAFTVDQTTSNNGDAINLVRHDNTVGHRVSMNFRLQDSNSNLTFYNTIGSEINDNTDTSEDGDLVIRNIYNGTLTERLRVTSAGGLQITGSASSSSGTIQTGSLTADRTYTLPNETGTFCLRNSSNCGFADATNAHLQGGNSFSTAAIIGTNDNFGIIFEANDTEVARFTASGNLGLGNTPNVKLDVSGAVNLRAISTPSVSPASQGRIYYDSSSQRFMVSENGGTYTRLVGSSTMQQAYTNSVGGTTPEVKLDSTRGGLDIQDADTTIGANLINVRASNGSGLGTVMFGIGNTGQATFQNSVDSTTALQVKESGGNVVLNVDTTNERVGIGTDSPDGRLHVAGENFNDSRVITQRSTADNLGAHFDLRKSRGTLGSEADIQSGDTIGFLRASGYQDGDYRGAGYVSWVAADISALNEVSSNFFVGVWNTTDSAYRHPLIVTDDSKIGLGSEDSTPEAQVDIETTDATNVGLLIQGTTSQSADYLQVKSTSATLVSVDSGGILKVGTTASPTMSGAKLLVTNAEITTDLRIGDGTDRVETNASGQLRYFGASRNTKSIHLSPEYPGTVLVADGSSNLGTLTSDYDTTGDRNYYKWTTTQSTSQDYDVLVRVPIPKDFDGFTSSSALSIDVYNSVTTVNTIQTRITDSNSVDGSWTDITHSTTNTWATKSPSILSGTFTAGEYMVVRLRLTSPQNGDIRIGDIKMDYYSAF